MSIEEKLKDLSKFAHMHTTQLITSAIVSFITGFVLHKSMTDPCIRSIVCEEIIDDRDKLSDQLDQERQSCLDEKKEMGKSIRDKLNKECTKSIEEATKDCEFSERHHCRICKARGVCKWKEFF